MRLQDLVTRSAKRTPDALAVQSASGAISYGALDRLANRIAAWLVARGVQPGDRVAIWLSKSPTAIAAMQAALRIGAAYVPVDPLSPTARVQMILEDCGVAAVVTHAAWAEAARTGALAGAAWLAVDGAIAGHGWDDVEALPDDPPPEREPRPDELAYVLYTSGSTGRPKGVCISHRNAIAFIEWAAATVEATARDRFANHAPFHFDLSVLDLYVAFLAGASVHLVAEGGNYSPEMLVELLTREQITVWYSVPSALMLMMERGRLLETAAPALRVVLFAGEPFPIKHLRELRRRWADKRFLNLYGPTETNVCTAYEVGDIGDAQTLPVPIGTATCGDRVWAVKPDGSIAGVGEEGELLVSGPTVMLGYFGKEPQGDRPYLTGDIVRLEPDGNYVYLGRRDHMVKVRGFRIELGEIESALLSHAAIKEAAVVVNGVGAEARLVAFLAANVGARPSLIAIKEYLADRVPRYMVVDQVRWLPELPRTRNGKVDRLVLGNELTRERT
jgi:amino acid adenylation domain-containing protein